MKRTISALVAVLALLPVPGSVHAQSMYRCVDPSGNVAYGAGPVPTGGGHCSQLTIQTPRPVDPPAAPIASEQTFEEQSKACDDFYRSQAASASQAPGSATLEATCEQNTRERYRRDGGQPETQQSAQQSQ